MQMVPHCRSESWFEGLFASHFMKLSVNTISRTDNVDHLLFRSMDRINDALTPHFHTTKADQTGESRSKTKRLYANPFRPEICVVLELAVSIFCKHRTGDDDAVFPFNDQNKCFYSQLTTAVHKKIDSTVDLGCARVDIDRHSFCKFAESTSVSKIDGPSRTQVCLGAGQGVGRT